MNISDLLSQGVDLMLLGMGMVFFILGLLIFLIKAISILMMKYEPLTLSHGEQATRSAPPIDKDVIAAISIAVQRFRSK
ncbi:MAG: OadG family protein [Cycloclasticus sp.]|nr:OadG family protein [Cycloclasticus sp.]